MISVFNALGGGSSGDIEEITKKNILVYGSGDFGSENSWLLYVPLTNLAGNLPEYFKETSKQSGDLLQKSVVTVSKDCTLIIQVMCYQYYENINGEFKIVHGTSDRLQIEWSQNVRTNTADGQFYVCKPAVVNLKAGETLSITCNLYYRSYYSYIISCGTVIAAHITMV